MQGPKRPNSKHNIIAYLPKPMKNPNMFDSCHGYQHDDTQLSIQMNTPNPPSQSYQALCTSPQLGTKCFFPKSFDTTIRGLQT